MSTTTKPKAATVPAARKKFPTKEQLRTIGITNGYDLVRLLAEPKVFISFSPRMTGRGYQPGQFQVIHLDHQTNPNGHWQDHGHKTFRVALAITKEQALADAIKWTDATFGKSDWVRDPFGDYQDSKVIALTWAVLDVASGK
jgi:hypothetical protein